MGDSMSWAADQEEDRRQASPEYAANKKRCGEWNKLQDEIYDRKSFALGDLRWLLSQPEKLQFNDQLCREHNLLKLRKIVESGRSGRAVMD